MCVSFNKYYAVYIYLGGWVGFFLIIPSNLIRLQAGFRGEVVRKPFTFSRNLIRLHKRHQRLYVRNKFAMIL